MNTQGFKLDLIQQSNQKSSTKHDQLISNNKVLGSQRKNQMLIDYESELMQLQLEEAKTREENIKQMNANIMSALSNMENENSANSHKNVSELQQKLEQHIKEIVELKKKQEQRMQSLEQQKVSLQKQLSEEKQKSQDYQLQTEQFQLIFKAKQESYVQENQSQKQEIDNLKLQIEKLNNIIKEKEQIMEVVGKENTELGKKISIKYELEKSNQKDKMQRREETIVSQQKQRLGEMQMAYENQILELNEQVENLQTINESLAFQLKEKNNEFSKLLKEFNDKCLTSDSEC